MSVVYNILAVFIGSGLGGVCRWGVSNCLNGSYPFGTFAVNVIGCFLIGLFSHALPCNSMYKLVLVTGFCGGFTTFSTFINENFLMLSGTRLLVSIAYIALSLIVGLLFAWLGWNIKA